jgi:hypothetical protein
MHLLDDLQGGGGRVDADGRTTRDELLGLLGDPPLGGQPLRLPASEAGRPGEHRAPPDEAGDALLFEAAEVSPDRHGVHVPLRRGVVYPDDSGLAEPVGETPASSFDVERAADGHGPSSSRAIPAAPDGDRPAQ